MRHMLNALLNTNKLYDLMLLERTMNTLTKIATALPALALLSACATTAPTPTQTLLRLQQRQVLLHLLQKA